MSILEIVGIAFGVNIMIGLLFWSLIILPSMKEQYLYSYTKQQRVTHFFKCVVLWSLALFGIINWKK